MAKQQKHQDAAQMFSTPGEEPVAKAPRITEVEASAIVANSECVFTEGCRGRVYAYNTVKVAVNIDGKDAQETRQQLRCNTCGRVATGYRVVGGSTNRRLFDRRAGR